MAQQSCKEVMVDKVINKRRESEVLVIVSNADEDSKHDENESFCYESDYEYNDEDSNEGDHAAICTVGLKRKTPASASLTDVVSPLSKSTKAGQKLTGLSGQETQSCAKVSAFSARTEPLPGDRTVCGLCHRQFHSPWDCAMISDWLEVTGDKASGILCVDKACIQACMSRRVRECCARLEALRDQYQDVPVEIFVRNEEKVAVDLLRYHWNVENWQAAFRRRADLQQQLQHPTPYGATPEQLQQMIDRLGLDETPVTCNANRNATIDNAAQRVQQDHDNFLRRTLNEAGPFRRMSRVEAVRLQSSLILGPEEGRRLSAEENESDDVPEVVPSVQMAREVDVNVGSVLASSRQEEESINELEAPLSAPSSTSATTVNLDLQPPFIVPSPAPALNATNNAGREDKTGFVFGNFLDTPSSYLRRLVNRNGDGGDNTSVQDTPQDVAAGGSTHQDQAAPLCNEALVETPMVVKRAVEAHWTCEICMDEDVDQEDRLSMECEHEYCRDCWAQFLLGMLEDVRAVGGVLATPAFCPHPRCRRKITRRHVEQMAPNLLPMYDEMALNSFLQGHSGTVRWCPGPNCLNVAVHSRRGLFLHEHGEVDRFAKCDFCNTRFCYDCGDLPHPGRACVRIYDEREAAIGVDEGVADGENIQAEAHGGARAVRGRVALVPVRNGQVAELEDIKTDKKIRLCPSCSVPIEKNGGCNHMSCKCGHQFCWLCMASTAGLHGMHWCGREPGLDEPRRGRNHAGQPPQAPTLHRMDLDYVSETVQHPEFHTCARLAKDVRQKQKELHRFAHYYNRFMAHNQGQLFAENQCECLAGRAIDFTRVSELHSGTDTDFFQLANQRLVASRRMLKYTYAFLYYKLGSTKDDNVIVDYIGCPADSANSSSLPTYLALFLEHQERLERMTEQLSFLSENALTRKDRKCVVDMINTVDRCMHAVTALAFEEEFGKSGL